MVFRLADDHYTFPDIELAEEDGLLAIGGDLSPGRLLNAYQSGIFPWFDNQGYIFWYSPDPRFLLFPQDLKVSKSMKQVLRSGKYECTVNEDFAGVIEGCSEIKRDGQQGTWISPDFIAGYNKMHELGMAHSVECWHMVEGQRRLAGGLYGINLGSCFMGESMFSRESNASKTALIHLLTNFKFSFIDCQVHTPHLASMGGTDVPRLQYHELLKSAIQDSHVLSVHISHNF